MNGGIVCMVSVQTTVNNIVSDNNKRSCSRVQMVRKVSMKRFESSEKHIQLINICKRRLLIQVQCRQAVDFNAVQDLVSCLAIAAKRDYFDSMTRFGE